MKFSELCCQSNFTFLKGSSHPEELVLRAHEIGYDSIAITDECSVAGVVRAWREINRLKSSLKLIVGSCFEYEDSRFVVIAKDLKSYNELCLLITHCRQHAEKGSYLFSPTLLKQYIKTGFVLWQPNPGTFKAIEKDFPDAYYFNEHNMLSLILNLDLTDKDQEKRSLIESLKDQLNCQVLASSCPVMHTQSRKPLHDVLCGIRLNQSIFDIKDKLLPNAERHLRSLNHLSRIYPENYINNTQLIANQCHFQLDDIAYHYPEETVPDGIKPITYLKKQTWIGAHKRYGKVIPKKVKKNLKKEFQLIQELQYEYYFLTVFDITQYAKSKKILHQGRGSAANSSVCFCLGITEVDPDKNQLLFERFLNRRRNEPPDIDVDFDNSRREEVIQYLYKKYGRDRCAIAATVITYRSKSALRDVGKALGLDLVHLESVIAGYGWRYRSKNWIDEIIDERISKDHHFIEQFKKILSQILGFPRHLSQHVGGFVLSQEPLNQLVPIENANMADRTVIQWDKDDLEAVKLMKVDILALGMLAALQKCLDNLSEFNNKQMTLSDINRSDDPKVYRMLQKADSVGLFQVESRAQMNMLPRLKPENFYDLVVQVAIVRPGPIHGDMVHPYLKRKHGLESVDVPLKSMEPILARTYGVPIFQEQVISLAMVAADFTADEAEELRRSMASWKKQGHMNTLRRKLGENLSKKGVEASYIERISSQIEGFGEYGFPESHAASFALIAYYSAWMKYYYPAIFCCALLNSQPMGFYPPWQLIQDAQRHNVKVLPIDVNHSHWDHTVIKEDDDYVIQLGLRLVKGLSKEQGEAIAERRPNEGYRDILHCVQFAALNKKDTDALSSAHAFKSFGDNRFENRWQTQAHDYYTGLFREERTNSDLGQTVSRTQNFLQDLQSTGVTLEDHPMAYLRDEHILDDCVKACDLISHKQKAEIYTAGVITNRQRPKTSQGVTFVTLEDETGSINLVVWLSTAQKQLKTLTTSKILKVYGKIDKDESSGIVHVIAYRLFDISNHLDEFKRKSRDYH